MIQYLLTEGKKIRYIDDKGNDIDGKIIYEMLKIQSQVSNNKPLSTEETVRFNHEYEVHFCLDCKHFRHNLSCVSHGTKISDDQIECDDFIKRQEHDQLFEHNRVDHYISRQKRHNTARYKYTKKESAKFHIIQEKIN